MTDYIDNMTKLTVLAPSKESEHALINPITVVSRSIAIDSIVSKHSHSWGQFVYAHSGVLAVSTSINRYIVPPEQGVWLLPEVEHEVTAISDIQIAISQLSLGKSVTSISQHLGYESPSSFIHMFKTKTGVVPSFYLGHIKSNRNREENRC